MLESSGRTGPLAVIVMGVCGSGKSTLGAALAARIGCRYLEGDDFHSPASIERMRSGAPLGDDDRWPWLDRLGRAVTGELTRGGIAVASCSALKRSYRDRLRAAIPARVMFVLLEGDPAELRRRMTGRTDHYMPASLLDSQLETLERPQPDEVSLTLDAALPTEILCVRVMGEVLGSEIS